MKTRSIGKKINTPVKQPFMFLFRCFLLLCWLELAFSAPQNFAAWGTLGPIEAFWGLLGPIVVKTAVTLGPSGDYRGLLRVFGVCVSKKPFLGRYMYGDCNSVR
jgi:hypothetical protein